MKTKLVGSAATLEKLIDLIKQHYYWAIVSAIETNKPNVYKVYTGTREIDGFIIKHKKNRWRLEMVVTNEN